MADPVCILCASNLSLTDPLCLGMFSALRLAIVRPAFEQVIRFSDTGDYLVSSMDDLLSILHKEAQVNFGVWVDEAIHAFVQVRLLGESVTSVTLYLDLLEDSVKVRIADEMVNRFHSLDGKRMIMVDLVGDSLEYIDWISFFQNESATLDDHIPTTVSPTLLGLQRSRFAPLKERFTNYQVTEVADTTIATRHRSLSEFAVWQQRRYQGMGEWKIGLSTSVRVAGLASET